jgi:hypothetical protein
MNLQVQKVFEVTFLTLLSESTKIPEVTADPDIVADPAVPAVLLLKGPCTPPPEAEAPPPPVNVNILPVVDPDIVVLAPPPAFHYKHLCRLHQMNRHYKRLFHLR